MEKLSKFLKSSEMSKEAKNEAVKSFLRMYINTSHSSTQVSPNMLL